MRYTTTDTTEASNRQQDKWKSYKEVVYRPVLDTDYKLLMHLQVEVRDLQEKIAKISDDLAEIIHRKTNRVI